MRAQYREEPCRSALNPVKGMEFAWSLNPYMGCAHQCTFCYVRGFERRADRPWDDRYGASIRVKINIAEVLRTELVRPSWKGEDVAVGVATDAYQPAEARYRLTRACLEALCAASNPFSIVTRAPLVRRDIDVLQEASLRAQVSVSFSLPTLDERVWRHTEPGSPHPRQRLRAMRELVRAGIRAGVGMAPLLPGLSDRPEQLARVVRAARAAGATFLWASTVNLRPGTREHFLEQLAREWPEQLPLYETLFRRRAYLPSDVTDPAENEVRRLARLYDVRDRRAQPLRPAPRPQQLSFAYDAGAGRRRRASPSRTTRSRSPRSAPSPGRRCR